MLAKLFEERRARKPVPLPKYKNMKRSSASIRLERRHRRVRAKIFGTSKVPRLSVSRSSKHMQAQIIDDEKQETLVGLSDRSLNLIGTKREKAGILGSEIAKQAREKGVKKVVFDRGGFRYHGRVQSFAQGAREGGLEF